MTKHEILSEREEIETLLPWYVVGTLTEPEMKRVAAYIARHPEFQSQLDLVREEMAETAASNEALPTAPAGALGRLMEQVQAEPTPRLAAIGQAGRGLWQGLADMFTLSAPQAVRWATATAAVVILAQAVALGVLLSERSGDGYETASGHRPSATTPAGTRLLVQFKPTANAGAIATLLTEFGAEVVGGPRPGGAFVIRISEKLLAEGEKNAIITRMKMKSDVVGLVLPVE